MAQHRSIDELRDLRHKPPLPSAGPGLPPPPCPTAAAAALILSLESVFAAFFGWLLLGETLVFIALLGCSLIFLSIILAELVSEHHLKKVFSLFSRAQR